MASRVFLHGTGRVFWAWVSDSIGRRNPSVFGVLIALIGLCYGGGFGTMPSFTADFFGAKNIGGIYGWILLAWGAAAAVAAGGE